VGQPSLEAAESFAADYVALLPGLVERIDKALEIAARHGCCPLRGVARYEDPYKLTYVRGPSGILVMLAEELKKN
jgi:hypothetical protein